MCGGAVGDFFAGFDDMVHDTVESTLAQAKFYITHPLEAVEVAALMYFGVPPTVAMSTVSYANGHGSIEQVGISVVQAYAPQIGIEGVPPEMMNVITSASSSAAVAAIQGKPLNEVFSAGLSGSVKGLVMNELSSQGLDVKSFSNRAISDAVGNASNAILNGQSVGDAIAASASKSLVSKGMQETTGALKSTWDNIYKNNETLQDIGSTFNSVKSQAQDAWNSLTSYQSTAQAQVNESNSLLGTLNSQQAQIQELSGRFDEQVRYANDPGTSPQIAGKTFAGGMLLVKAYQDVQNAARAEASNLANQINSLNDQASGTLNQFNSVKAGYEDTVSKIAPLQTQLASYNEQLTNLDSQATTLDTQTKDLTATLIDKLKDYQDLEKEFGTEIAQQIASTAAEALKSQPGTLQIGDTVDTGFGEEVTLADGTKGKITQTGEVIAADKPSDIIPAVNKEPKGTVTLSTDPNYDKIVKPGNVNDTSHLDVIPESAELQPDNTFLDPKTGIKYIPNDDGTVTTVNPSDEPVVNLSPLTPNPAAQKTGAEFYDALIAQGVEPALATKMSGHTPSGGPGGLPTGTPGEPNGPGGPSGLPTGTPGGPGGPGGPGILPTVPPLTPPPVDVLPTNVTSAIPTNPDLKAGELIVEGTVPKPYEPFESDFPIQPDETPPVTPTTPVKTPTTAIGTVTSPKTPTTTTTTPKTTGALPTATTPQASSGSVAPSSGTSQSGGIPTPISGQSLAAAPVYANTQILQQLKQLDPKLLSMVAPHLSGQSGPTGLSALSPQIPQQATGGNMQQSNPYNTLFQTMLADKGGTNPSYGAPMFSAASSMLGYATGGGAKMDDYLTHIKKLRDKEQTGALMSSGLKLLGAPAYNTMGFKDGGHIPEFKTGTTGHYVKGAGDGQSDDIPAMLADGEYVFDADTVASLGNGSSDAGAQLLDHFREAAREHKRSAPVDKIPPKASPLAYMKEALKRHARG
jgi:peptidoglycan hydrolase CwlO-like protein